MTGKTKVKVSDSERRNEYWRANIRLMLSLLLVWFLVSFVCGILLVDFLNQYRFFGFKLGFWFSQQGSILVFVGLIFIYALRMNQLDKAFGVEEKPSKPLDTEQLTAEQSDPETITASREGNDK